MPIRQPCRCRRRSTLRSARKTETPGLGEKRKRGAGRVPGRNAVRAVQGCAKAESATTIRPSHRRGQALFFFFLMRRSLCPDYCERGTQRHGRRGRTNERTQKDGCAQRCWHWAGTRRRGTGKGAPTVSHKELSAHNTTHIINPAAHIYIHTHTHTNTNTHELIRKKTQKTAVHTK